MRLLGHLFLAGTLAVSACGDEEHCPGQCPAPGVPTLTIKTADGTASIASAKVLGGPCVHLLCDSAGEAGVPAGYATARITCSGASENPPPCLVELTSLAGDRVQVTAQAKSPGTEVACCAYGSCCPRLDTIRLHGEVVFDPPLVTIAFAPGVDGGLPPDAGEAVEAQPYDAGAEPALDGAQSVDGEESVDANLAVDVEESIDADHAVDAGAAVDMAIDL